MKEFFLTLYVVMILLAVLCMSLLAYQIVIDTKEVKKMNEILNQLNLFYAIKKWGIDRNLHTADPNKQLLKLDEEVQELKEAMAKNDRDLTIDSIGDITVVLVQLSSQLGLDYISCVKSAYEEIKDRKGKMINGVFVKESDLGK